ncbi:MAG: hypothetical protein AB1515_02460 [Nitrospirota bacterium]
MNQQQRIAGQMKIWPLVVISLIAVAGFIYWDSVTHRSVREYVIKSPEIPGAAVVDGTEEAAAFRHMAHNLTRQGEAGGMRIAVVWNSPAFFNALATAEAAKARDVARHKTLYQGYAERFGVHRDLVFTVMLDSPSTDFDYPIHERSLLRNDKGIEVVPSGWQLGSRSSSRHLEGILTFPQRTAAGEAVIGHLIGEHMPGESPPAAIELTLKALPGGGEAKFRWELPAARQEAEGG